MKKLGTLKYMGKCQPIIGLGKWSCVCSVDTVDYNILILGIIKSLNMSRTSEAKRGQDTVDYNILWWAPKHPNQSEASRSQDTVDYNWLHELLQWIQIKQTGRQTEFQEILSTPSSSTGVEKTYTWWLLYYIPKIPGLEITCMVKISSPDKKSWHTWGFLGWWQLWVEYYMKWMTLILNENSQFGSPPITWILFKDLENCRNESLSTCWCALC